jgi:hypothetical protein
MTHHIELHTGLNFTDADLKANQRGQLTEAQRQCLRTMVADVVRSALTFAIFMPVVCGCSALLTMVNKWQDISKTVDVTLCFILLGSPFTLVMIGLAGFSLYRLRADLSDTQAVKQVTGYISRKKRWDDDRFEYRYRMMIKDVTFTMPVLAYYAFQENHIYTLYYTAHSKTILSAEIAPDEG